ncbi:hypothetical protein AB0D91_21635 [Streptomyces canus]
MPRNTLVPLFTVTRSPSISSTVPAEPRPLPSGDYDEDAAGVVPSEAAA